jgi:hypothetical protein
MPPVYSLVVLDKNMGSRNLEMRLSHLFFSQLYALSERIKIDYENKDKNFVGLTKSFRNLENVKIVYYVANLWKHDLGITIRKNFTDVKPIKEHKITRIEDVPLEYKQIFEKYPLEGKKLPNSIIEAKPTRVEKRTIQDIIHKIEDVYLPEKCEKAYKESLEFFSKHNLVN